MPISSNGWSSLLPFCMITIAVIYYYPNTYYLMYARLDLNERMQGQDAAVDPSQIKPINRPNASNIMVEW